MAVEAWIRPTEAGRDCKKGTGPTKKKAKAIKTLPRIETTVRILIFLQN